MCRLQSYGGTGEGYCLCPLEVPCRLASLSFFPFEGAPRRSLGLLGQKSPVSRPCSRSPSSIWGVIPLGFPGSSLRHMARVPHFFTLAIFADPKLSLNFTMFSIFPNHMGNHGTNNSTESTSIDSHQKFFFCYHPFFLYFLKLFFHFSVLLDSPEMFDSVVMYYLSFI